MKHFIEPFRIKALGPNHLTSRAERERLIQEVLTTFSSSEVVGIVYRCIATHLIKKTGLPVRPLRPAHADAWRARLDGYQEVPALSTSGAGSIGLRVNRRAERIDYVLDYASLEGGVLQAHLHFGRAGTNGGISAFLCTNLDNGPAGTPLCPPGPATVSGSIGAPEVIGPAAQGIGPGELGELIDALEAGAVYANVHSDLHPGGEIRGQLGRGRR